MNTKNEKSLNITMLCPFLNVYCDRSVAVAYRYSYQNKRKSYQIKETNLLFLHIPETSTGLHENHFEGENHSWQRDSDWSLEKKIFLVDKVQKSLCTVVQILKKVAKIQKNRNFDIRFFDLFFKSSTLGVS